MKPLIILTGPTAVGKTALSIQLAKAINGEIISADSVQVYRNMDIGSAKIRSEEMAGVPHHLIDVLDPSEDFDVARFKEMAVRAVQEIYARDHIPILVGGTGFYIQALLYDIDFNDGSHDDRIREKYSSYADRYGAEVLYELLQKCDPKSCNTIHPNNVQRVIRALEYYDITGQKISDHNASEREKESPYRFAYFVLTDNRQTIYQKIEKRVDLMMEEGLVEEVAGLLSSGLTADNSSMKALGYKEIAAYLTGECSLDEAVNTLKKETRHFAKRQLTWFKRERDVIYLDRTEEDEEQILSHIMRILKEKEIING